jgi:hypothetical protein
MVRADDHGCSAHHKVRRLKIGPEGMIGHVASTGTMHYAPDVRDDSYYVVHRERK